MEGVSIRMFGPSRPADEDLLTDEMIAEYREAFGDKVAAVSITESLGSGTVTQKDTSSFLNCLSTGE